MRLCLTFDRLSRKESLLTSQSLPALWVGQDPPSPGSVGALGTVSGVGGGLWERPAGGEAAAPLPAAVWPTGQPLPPEPSCSAPGLAHRKCPGNIGPEGRCPVGVGRRHRDSRGGGCGCLQDPSCKKPSRSRQGLCLPSENPGPEAQERPQRLSCQAARHPLGMGAASPAGSPLGGPAFGLLTWVARERSGHGLRLGPQGPSSLLKLMTGLPPWHRRARF